MIHPLQRLTKAVAPTAPASTVPSDWLPLPTLAPGSEEFAGLFAVFEAGSNFCALKFSGAYTVDWGDGTIENVNADTQAQHEFDYADLAPESVSVAGYRQAIVRVTPQAGQHLTAVSLACRHSSMITATTSQWLDIKLNAPNCTNLKIGGAAADYSYNHSHLQRATVQEIGPITDLSFLFANCLVLHTINAFDTSACQDFTAMFFQVYGITEPPLFDMSATTTIYGMFSMAGNLKRVPAYDLSNLVTADSIFYGNYSLSSCRFTGLRYSIDLSGFLLSAAAIDEIFTNLGVAAGAQTINVKANHGAAACTPAIAQAKGWTVVTA